MNARSKILQVCAVDFTVYHFLLPLMRAQREWGFEVEVACTAGRYAARIEAEGFRLHDLPMARTLNPLAHLRAYRALRRLLGERSYEVVHVHTPVAAAIGRPAARRSGVPVVVYTAHGFYFHDAMNPALRRAHVTLERWAQRHADYLFTQSAEDRATAIRERIASEERALAIGNGVDLTRFRPDLLDARARGALRSELGVPEGGVLVAMMGRLVREKGCFEMIEAWARIAGRSPHSRLIFIGGALASDREDSEAALRRKIEELKIGGSVRLLGLREDVPRLLAAADLFVLPSWREGMPRSILEAMASGVAVLATDIRGSREEVVPGETGRLVPARDAEALAGALAELLADADLRKRMGDAGRRRAETFFDERLVLDRQRAAFEHLFREKGLRWPEPGGNTA